MRSDKTLKHKKPTRSRFIKNLIAATLLLVGVASCGESGNKEQTESPATDVDINYTATDAVVNTEADYFEEWDTNKDRQWTRDEFMNGLHKSEMFVNWDIDDDNYFSEEEFDEGLFSKWDQNANDFLSKDEFADVYLAGNENLEDNFSTWDLNNDNRLNKEEFYAGVRATKEYEHLDIDNDGLLSADEYSYGLFDSWDKDRSGYLDLQEYEKIDLEKWYDRA